MRGRCQNFQRRSDELSGAAWQSRGQPLWAEDLALFGWAPVELLGVIPAAKHGHGTPNKLIPLLRYEAERARLYYLSAERLLPLLRGPGRAMCQALLRTYRGLLDEIDVLRDVGVADRRDRFVRAAGVRGLDESCFDYSRHR